MTATYQNRKRFEQQLRKLTKEQLLVLLVEEKQFRASVQSEVNLRRGAQPVLAFFGLDAPPVKAVRRPLPYKNWGKFSNTRFAAPVAEFLLLEHPELKRVQKQHLEWYVKNHAHTIGDLKRDYGAVYDSLMNAVTSYYSLYDRDNPDSPHTRKARDTRRKAN